MRTIKDIEKVMGLRRPPCLTIGTFDGVHLGHQAVIGRVIDEATRRGLTSVVMTFDPHPRISLGKGASPPLLTCTRHKLSLLEELGVNLCLVLNLDGDLGAMSPSDFVEEILCRRLGVAMVVAGPRLRFGKGRKGTPTLLRELGEKLRFGVEVVAEIIVGGVPVSSTVVRRSVLRGELSAAERLLGKRLSVLGRVVRGRTLGRKLGYRTANVEPLDQVIPPAGVYAVEVIVNRERHPGALNLGWRPTFSSQNLSSPVLEAHILDFDKSIYDREVEIVFHRRIREERRFATPQDLARQIPLDIEAVKGYFLGKTTGDSPRRAAAAASSNRPDNGIC